MTDGRIERDSMGEVRVPGNAQVAGADPARGRELPDLRDDARARPDRGAGPHQGGGRIGQGATTGRSSRELAEAIIAAADAVARGDHDDQFPIDVFQTGSGTSSNMNMNEVLGHPRGRGARAARPSRTTTSTTRCRRTTCSPPRSTSPPRPASSRDLVPALEHLAGSLEAQGRGVRRRREGRPHAPHGRDAGDARARSSAATRPRCASASSACRPRCRGWPSCRSAGRPSGTGINCAARLRRPGDRRAGRPRPACR